MENNRYIIIGGSIVLIIVLLTTAIYSFLYFDNRGYTDKFYSGVLVNDIDISEMSKTEATEKISSVLLNPSLIFSLDSGDKKWEVPKSHLVTYEIESTLEEILKKQRANNLLKAYQVRKSLGKVPENHPISYNVKDDLRDILQNIAAETEIRPKDAQFVITDSNTVEISPHTVGRTVDMEESILQVLIALENNIESSSIIYKDYEPDTLTSDLEKLKVNDLILSVETNYGGTGGNRIFNIQLAASKIRNHLLLPGDEFSFNNIVGQADKASGYKEAIIIVNGKFVPGYGGGVCQVSSNIYLGALKANLEILQRRAHGRPVSYLPRGLDATIAYPSLDLRFKNNTPYGIIINTRTTNNKLIVDFYSYKPHYPTVRFEHDEEVIPFETEYKENPNLKKGERKIVQKGALGYRVVTYRIMTHDGNTTKEVISTDTYRPQKQIIEVGSKPVSSDSLDENNEEDNE